ncbi:tripartite tricarboxylate transporter substrate binding protein [Bordetella hinzii]|uniref:Tripartite tricarboxylate transporter substrate binding protein n=1 Tax=Bordetella hinzii TaxID=103855 RepID=A0AAN1RVR2_9BORD|nr:tripartite tricarboxylate transporter substrate binding protein [Bordetella hinzii]AKQ58193.1 Tripartite tricarboxylate transporter family receptor [Bordetella hinzii]AZW16463.1 tripartite tricarboxylate transporter substrate binding protein [Bordetella hinzii]KCB46168.1 tripartite tricarboxylate transporter family receptor [Bordetella hinzii 4161]KCB47206.1 tripartite tricarboxylate transporter family receptor [Bordetella hinzii 1277]KXA71995.1 ABC transporter substrate-binding protein [Bo
MTPRWLRPTLLAAALALPIACAQAANYPDKPINIIVPFSPGGVTDVMARLVAEKLQEDLKVPVVVVNKPGAGTTIATNYVARSAPDGYTVLMAASTFAVAPALYKEKAGYDPEKDFRPVSLLAAVPHLLVVAPGLPADNVASLVTFLKAGDGKQGNYSSSGPGTSNHLEGELFSTNAGVRPNHIPYRGSVPALSAIAAGEVNFMFVDVAAAKPFLEGGKVRALAVTTAKRSALLPDLPTVGESGVVNFSATPWLGFVVPAQVPDPVVATLGGSLAKMAEDPKLKQRFYDMGLEPSFSPPAEFGRFMAQDRAKWNAVIQQAGIVTLE